MLIGEAPAAAPVFTSALAVPNAGVLVAIPALVENGLFHELGSHIQSPRGYYGMPQLVLLLALLTLSRVLSLEMLRGKACGEWGRLLGLDRIPEVRTLREKINVMVTATGVAAWAESLGKLWMQSDPQLAGVLYFIPPQQCAHLRDKALLGRNEMGVSGAWSRMRPLSP